MAKITFTMKNEKGEDVLYSSKEITTRDYRDYLVLNDSLTSEKSEVEKLDQQLNNYWSTQTLRKSLKYLWTSTLIW